MAFLEPDKKKNVLGRGLASLIPEAKPGEGAAPKKDYFLCDIEKIVPSTYQPRKIFQKEALDELVESIKSHGIIQPLIVRNRNGSYELIAGERRWRAAQRAGLKQVPVVVKEVADNGSTLEMAIIENVQRADLNCIEEAIAYQQLMDEFQLSQDDIATRVGKNRATIANTIRLLKLPVAVREDLSNGKLTMGHARAILSLESAEQQLEVRDLVLKKKLSVRDTERKVSELLRQKSEAAGTLPEGDVHLKALEEDVRKIFGAQVRIVGNMDRGFIQISYGSKDDLMRISDRLKGDTVATQDGSI
jgi:ParB family transcriptional regulator, chromosome partitioning protein